MVVSAGRVGIAIGQDPVFNIASFSVEDQDDIAKYLVTLRLSRFEEVSSRPRPRLQGDG
jgi:hypothetical protein